MGGVVLILVVMDILCEPYTGATGREWWMVLILVVMDMLCELNTILWIKMKILQVLILVVMDMLCEYRVANTPKYFLGS